jgi:hypothetical protein
MGLALKRRNEYLGDLASGKLGGRTVHILKPSTYMNLSGKSLIRTVDDLSADVRTNVLVLVDDVHLPFGQLRVRTRIPARFSTPRSTAQGTTDGAAAAAAAGLPCTARSRRATAAA